MPENKVGRSEFEVHDVEYLRHGAKPLLARIFKPRGKGPFPAMIEAHGGVWCQGDRVQNTVLNERLAKSGIVIAALDFRMPPEASYPGSIADINYAVRWLKAHASEYSTEPELVGAIGNSSGAHQVILAGMRPRDTRYAAIRLPAGSPPVDATLAYAVLCWPVIDPLGRYQYAKSMQQAGDAPEVLTSVIPSQEQYWGSEQNMAEGSPVRILDRREKIETPNAQYIQATQDQMHPREHLDRFVAGYRKIGGKLELELFESSAQSFIVRDPSSQASAAATAKIIDFVHRQQR